ncbi:MAG: hypothetical protein A3D92_17770, partial [Bacteroidetes bacterium RIFCSPHIGHO2_02_FULL_44_7]
SSGIQPVLHFVPEESVRELHASGLVATEDKSSFDYVYSVAKLADPENAGLKVKHRLVSTFLKLYPDVQFEIRSLTDASVHQQMMVLFKKWGERKKARNSAYDLAHEESAILRLLSRADAISFGTDIFVSCAFLRGEMIGFGVDEIVQKQYALSHFIKGDIAYRGIYEFINERIAQHLLAHDVHLWNWEQDLDIEGLRKMKSTYHPAEFFKKYFVSEFPIADKTL